MQFAFSWRGFLVFMLPMLINIVYFMLPPVNAKEEDASENKILAMIEQVTRIGFAFVICAMVSNEKSSWDSPVLWGGGTFLVLYYIVWIRYFIGGREVALLGTSFLGIPMPLAIFPVIYYILSSVWLHNYYAMGIMVLFGIAHNILSYQNLYVNGKDHVLYEKTKY